MNLINKFNNYIYIGIMNKLLKYFSVLKVAYHTAGSLVGFSIFVIISNQLLSGVALALSLVPETMLISYVREEEDLENLYSDDFFWLHERGVDLLFITVFLHLLKKLYLNVSDIEQEYAWKTGAIAFLIIQVTVFAGLVLCNTHLSDITLVIAANVFHTIFLFLGKPYWFIFTDKSLNTDTLIRLAYLHYIIAFFLFYLGINHGVDMHYDWKSKNIYNGIKQQLNWWDEALSNELSKFLYLLIITGLLGEFLYSEPEALSYEVFMWGDVGIITDVRFYGVAPHWYFRPYMAWLIACPFHVTGVIGLVFFFVSIYFQVNINNNDINNLKILNAGLQILGVNYLNNDFYVNKYYTKWSSVQSDLSIQWLLTFGFFIISILYTLSFLPYGRFFNKLGGNTGFLMAYFYIFSFLGFSSMRNAFYLNNNKLIINNKWNYWENILIQ